MTYSILVVEDEPNIVESLSFLMKRAGHKVRIARDGDAAIRTMQAETPDLVLLDVMLPRRDGLEVCRLIRENASWRDIRVVMLTAKGRELDRRKGMEMGADEYITKPFATREIVLCVEQLLAVPRGAAKDGA
jgi:DNA-binding response OmpR family regulator